MDENDQTVEINQALCDMIGYSRAEIMDKTPFDFFEDRSKTNYKKILRKSRQTSDRSYEVTFITKQGALLYSKVDATSIFDEHGTFKGSFAFITDITNRIQAQQELHKETDRANAMARAAQAASKSKSENFPLSIPSEQLDPNLC